MATASASPGTLRLCTQCETSPVVTPSRRASAAPEQPVSRSHARNRSGPSTVYIYTRSLPRSNRGGAGSYPEIPDGCFCAKSSHPVDVVYPIALPPPDDTEQIRLHVALERAYWAALTAAGIPAPLVRAQRPAGLTQGRCSAPERH